MKESSFIISGIEPVSVLGPNNQNLALLESTFENVALSSRGNSITIRASEETLPEVIATLEAMTTLAKRKGNASLDQVKTLVTLSKGIKQADRPSYIDDTVILKSNAGKNIIARTPGQKRLVQVHGENDIVFAIGPAGTGKTYTAVALAARALRDKEVKKIVLCRPAVEAGESLGFLPGDLKDKIDPYLRPLYDSLEEMIPDDRLEYYLQKNIIEIVPLAYMRGRTLNNAFVILDEAQNATNLQMKMFLTRLGVQSKAIITGDITQTDLPNKQHSGLISVQEILANIKGIHFVYMGEEDVVRHKLIRQIIAAYEHHDTKFTP